MKNLKIFIVLFIAALASLFWWLNHRKVVIARQTLLSLAKMEQVFYERSFGYTESLRELSLVIPDSYSVIRAVKDSFAPGSLIIKISEDEKSVVLAAQALDWRKTWVSYTTGQSRKND